MKHFVFTFLSLLRLHVLFKRCIKYQCRCLIAPLAHPIYKSEKKINHQISIGKKVFSCKISEANNYEETTLCKDLFPLKTFFRKNQLIFAALS